MLRESFDYDYVRRLTEGDPETEQHFTSYFGQLLGIKLRGRLRSSQAVEDMRQETFLRVLNALRVKRNLESPEKLGAFVNATCNNLLLEQYRLDSRLPYAEPEGWDMPDRRASAESELVTEERKQQVRRVLEDLPERDREVLRMVFYEEADRADICRRFGVPQDYMRVLVHRAKARFKRCLLERHGEEFGPS